MAVESLCPHCGAAYCFTNDLTGQEVTCDECVRTFVVGLSVPRMKPNDGGNREGGIKVTAGPMQSQAPRFLPEVNDEDVPLSRPSLTKSGGGSWVAPTIVLLAIVLLGGGFFVISILSYGGGDNKETEAKVRIWTLEDAVGAYYLDYQKYPESLKELTERLPDGRAAKLPEYSLIDPWGKPYQYEPKNLNPTNNKPRIWSSGEPGERRPIANW
jgi:type II secretory pathway pseudopilin PulG